MKILFNGDISSIINKLDSLGITVTPYGENSFVLIFPEKCKLKKNVIPKDLEIPDGVPYLENYSNNNDTSLSDFIIKGSNILSTGNFEPVEDENLDYDYVCNSQIRLYVEEYINVVNYELSSQNDISEYYYFLERMLKSSDNVEKEKTM